MLILFVQSAFHSKTFTSIFLFYYFYFFVFFSSPSLSYFASETFIFRFCVVSFQDRLSLCFKSCKNFFTRKYESQKERQNERVSVHFCRALHWFLSHLFGCHFPCYFQISHTIHSLPLVS